MSIYICYDIKGIQSFIFKIPRLEYIIGGSAIIDRFDRETMKNLNISGAELVSNAGGKGSFRCADDSVANEVEKKIVEEGHKVGLEIRIGRAEKFIDASKTADKTYSFLPDDFSGEPCSVSGLYPADGKHPIVQQRVAPDLKHYFEEMLKKELTGLEGEQFKDGFEFFSNPESEQTERLLGSRNRWAIICLDGNDMGSQYRKKVEQTKDGDIDFDWLKGMSEALDTITKQATCAGILAVVKEWQDDGGRGNILPIRPIVVGGDDITVLCHCKYAFDFVKEVSRAFNNNSNLYSQYWVATGGELTISAGVLFAPVSYPLSTAIPYAEALLGSAKGEFREPEGSAKASSIDWESVTEGLLDTPAARRQRDLVFLDKSKGAGYELKLTKRPYLLTDFEEPEDKEERFEELEAKAQKYSDIPATVRASFLPGLHQPRNERLAFYARIKKNYPNIFKAMNEFEGIEKASAWQKDESESKKEKRENAPDCYHTDIIDAFLLLEEQNRMTKKQQNKEDVK
jgi:hypothetical protein